MRSQICLDSDNGRMIPAAELITDRLPIPMLSGYNAQGNLTIAVATHGRTEDGKPTVASFHMTFDEFDTWVDGLVRQRDQTRERLAARR